jgi:hypothetical protein
MDALLIDIPDRFDIPGRGTLLGRPGAGSPGLRRRVPSRSPGLESGWLLTASIRVASNANSAPVLDQSVLADGSFFPDGEYDDVRTASGVPPQ